MELNLFDEDNSVNDWKNHYIGMPEYNNVKLEEPAITATFKFRSLEDFEKFNSLLKEFIYINQKPFDGMQRKDSKSTWYPLMEKASKYVYENES
jgi:hypothetical protein